MNVISPKNPIVYLNADGIQAPLKNDLLQTSPSPTTTSLVKNAVKGLPVKSKPKTPIRGKIVKNKDYKPKNTGVAGGGVGSSTSSSDTTQPTTEETKVGFWASLSTIQKGLVVAGGLVVVYFGYKKFVKGK